MTSPVHIRLLNQQLYAPQFTDPAEVVSWFGAMQAQEYKLMRLAVTMRTRKPSQEAFRKAFDSGRIIRLHLLRCTWQLIAAEDHSWMVALCAPKALQAMMGWMHANKIHIPASEEAEIRALLTEAAAGGNGLTKDDFAAFLGRHGVTMDDHRLSYHIRLAELNGIFCSGRLDDRKATYALVSERIAPSPAISRDEALIRLARKYFQSHAPATLEDFVWWSGLNIGDCRRAVSLLGDSIRSETWKDGRVFHLLDSSRTRGYRNGVTLRLPSYDEYLIGYKSRDLVLPEELRPHAHNNSGIFYPVTARDGIICGNWKPTSVLDPRL